VKLLSLFGKARTRKTAARAARQARRRLRLETFEQRLLMAGDITLVGSILRIDGTDSEYWDIADVEIQDDEVIVRLAHYDAGVLLHEHTEDFDVSDVTEIFFFGYDGDNSFHNRTPLPSTAFGGDGRDQFTGGSARDIFYGYFGNDALWGREGDDSLYGGDGELDYLFGQGGDDHLYGENGPDWIEGGTGNDRLYGGGHDDTYYFLQYDVTPYPNLGQDVIVEYAGEGEDRISFASATEVFQRPVTLDLDIAGFQTVAAGYLSLALSYPQEIENVTGTPYDDVLLGNSKANKLEGRAGDDLLLGRSGNDDYVFDGREAVGVDTVVEYAGGGLDRLDFSRFDRYFGEGVSVDLAAAVKQLVASDLYLQLVNPEEIENLTGSQFDDLLFGNSQPNKIEGLSGDDDLLGKGGDDHYVLFSQDFYSSSQTVTIYESAGGGIDRLDFSQFYAGVTVKLASSAAQKVYDAWFGGLYIQLVNPNEFENVLGTAYADEIRGNSRDNLLEGWSGNDTLRGASGNDTLVGDADNDMLYGDHGVDTLRGGTGDDYLDGGVDNLVDYLYGGLGRDIFVRNYLWVGYWRAEPDQFLDFTKGDTIRNVYYSIG
jgi:Ca2+-binding RTX toxin-like protein